MCRLAARCLILGALCCAATFAQYPGTYPPGQYPGQGPLGGGGISLPGRHKKSQKNPKTDTAQPGFSAEGKTVSNDGKKLVVETQDGRTLTMGLTHETKYTRSGNSIDPTKIIPKTTVHIDASEDDQANLTAVTVELLKDAPVEAPAEARAQTPAQNGQTTKPGQDDDEEMARSTILHNPVDVPDRPVLRRGQPKKSTSSRDDDDAMDSGPPVLTRGNTQAKAPAKPEEKKESTDFTIDGENAPAKRPASNDLIERAKEWVQNFTSGLPNFVCEQVTTRYLQQSKSSGWDPLDIISAKVIYEDGKENYREIMVGGKRTSKSMLELGGSTSTGEFASTLRSLFSPGERADFKLFQSTTIAGSPATIYDFKVPLQSSGWFISVGGQALRPAYSGSVWIDRATAQVRRIEMQADNIPKDFPLDAVEWAVDYDNVRLGTGAFLLPTHAENLGCQRGSTICTKNTTDFRNYHRYSGESTITFK